MGKDREQDWDRPEGSVFRFQYTRNVAQANIFDRITVEPAKCGGEPCIRGLRITVRRVLELLAAHPHREDILKEYPFLEQEDLHQAQQYAAAKVNYGRLV